MTQSSNLEIKKVVHFAPPFLFLISMNLRCALKRGINLSRS